MEMSHFQPHFISDFSGGIGMEFISKHKRKRGDFDETMGGRVMMKFGAAMRSSVYF